MPQTDIQLVPHRKVSGLIRRRAPSLPPTPVMTEKLRREHDAPPPRAKAQRQIDVLFVHEKARIEHDTWAQRCLFERPRSAEHQCSASRRHLGGAVLGGAGGGQAATPVMPSPIPLLEDAQRVYETRRPAALDVETEERCGEATYGIAFGSVHDCERPLQEALGKERIGIQEEHVTAFPGRGIRHIVCLAKAFVAGQSDDPNRGRGRDLVQVRRIGRAVVYDHDQVCRSRLAKQAIQAASKHASAVVHDYDDCYGRRSDHGLSAHA